MVRSSLRMRGEVLRTELILLNLEGCVIRARATRRALLYPFRDFFVSLSDSFLDTGGRGAVLALSVVLEPTEVE